VPMEELPLETWKKVVDTNLTGIFRLHPEAIKIMKSQTPKGGRIVNTVRFRSYASATRCGLHSHQAAGDASPSRPRSIAGTIRSCVARVDIGNARRVDRQDGARRGCAAAGRQHGDRGAHERRRTSAARSVYIANLPLDTNVLS